jgi:hypothetical protein
MQNDTHRRPRRFSEGLEHMPDLPSSARVGRFSDGMTAAVGDAARPGTFADGQLLRPDAPAVRRVGSFADRFPPRIENRARPRAARRRTRPAAAAAGVAAQRVS